MNKGFQVGWWLVIITIAAMYTVSLPLLLVTPDINEYLLSLVGELGIIIAVLIGLFYCKKCGYNNVFENLGIKKFSPVLIPLCMLLVIGAQYFITYVTMPVQMLLVILFGADTATTQMLIPDNIWSFILAFFVLCVAAPVLEELFCRGILIKVFERYGILVSLIASSLAFALLHMEMRSFVQIFFIGLLLGAVRITTGSVIPTIIMHSLNNFLSFTQLVFFNNDVSIIYVLLSVTGLAFPVIMYFTFVKFKKYFDYAAVKINGEQKTGVSVAAIICIVGFVGFNMLLFLNRLVNGLCVDEIVALFEF